MDGFGNYMDEIVLAQLTKKYSSFKHVGYSYDSHIKITSISDTGSGIRVLFNIPANGNRKDKSEFYSYKTLLKCASNISYGSMFGDYY